MSKTCKPLKSLSLSSPGQSDEQDEEQEEEEEEQEKGGGYIESMACLKCLRRFHFDSLSLSVNLPSSAGMTIIFT